jgi:hypothetical protein
MFLTTCPSFVKKVSAAFLVKVSTQNFYGLLYSSVPTASLYHITYLDFTSTAIADIEHNLLSAFSSRMRRFLQAGGIIEYIE